MSKLDLSKLKDEELCKLIDNRWDSSYPIWEEIEKIYDRNTRIYENRADWLSLIPYKRRDYKMQANRIFVNMEAVINSLIANPAGLNILPAREGEDAKEFSRKMESYFRKKFTDLNVKEIMRMGLRNLYFARLIVLKPFWNSQLNDFDVRAINPKNVRFSKYARKEQDSEFAIEEIEDNLCSVIQRFPSKKDQLMNLSGIKTEEELYIKNPDIKYKECWIGDYVIFKYQNIILDKIKNPYWDWDGILITEEEEQQLSQLEGDARKQYMANIKLDQSARTPQEPLVGEENQGATPDDSVESPYGDLKAYYFNYFDTPRKPYIFATIFNNENKPIGRTDMITLSADLQHGIDKRKRDIDESCDLMKGIIKVDASVMGKSDAQRLRFETGGIIWGKGVKDGIGREVGEPLPQMYFDDMVDSRNEIDNIMAASSAFKGEREGQETKAGRLALIQQSYLRLNELVQVVDYTHGELFSWFFQLAKTRYTEPHYAKWMGKEDAQEVIEIMQDDFETGSEVTIISGKTLPKDDEFRFEQAQNDVEKGFISPPDYLKIAQYEDPNELARNAVLYQQNPAMAVGLNEMPLPGQPGELQPDQVTQMLNAGVQPVAPSAVAPMEPTPTT